MGSITRGLSNNITTGGVILPAGITNASVSAVTSFANAAAGTLTLISTQTASSSANISFTTGLNSTYDEYIFKFINIHPATDDIVFQVNFSTDGGSNYNVTKTTTNFEATHTEADETGFKYGTGDDIAQGTGYQRLGLIGNDNDESMSGELYLFAPSSTTFVKHFIGRTHGYYGGTFAWSNFCAGYCNTTSAVNAVDFKCSSGNIDDGVFKLYGVKKS
jgi:hypothetical protein